MAAFVMFLIMFGTSTVAQAAEATAYVQVDGAKACGPWHETGGNVAGTTPSLCNALCSESSTCVAANWFPSYGVKCYLFDSCAVIDSMASGEVHKKYIRADGAKACHPWRETGGNVAGTTPDLCNELCSKSKTCVAANWFPSYGDKCYLFDSCALIPSTASGEVYWKQPQGNFATICASNEDDECSCSGEVYRGRKYVSGMPGNGTITTLTQMTETLMGMNYSQKTVHGSITCSSDAFGEDPAFDYYKHCICVPQAPTCGEVKDHYKKAGCCGTPAKPMHSLIDTTCKCIGDDNGVMSSFLLDRTESNFAAHWGNYMISKNYSATYGLKCGDHDANVSACTTEPKATYCGDGPWCYVMEHCELAGTMPSSMAGPVGTPLESKVYYSYAHCQ